MENLNKEKGTKPCTIQNVRRSALGWWDKLSKPKQRDYEMQMFGYGEWWEDNSLHEDDIVKMFHHYA